MTEEEASQLAPVTDAGKMALAVAMRRDWRPFPVTQDWGAPMAAVLFEVAVQIEMEARAGLPGHYTEVPL